MTGEGEGRAREMRVGGKRGRHGQEDRRGRNVKDCEGFMRNVT